MSLIEKSLIKQLERANEAYRKGEPMLSDEEYDKKIAQLMKINPEHPYLKTVEPETAFNAKGEVKHKKPMLSTDKAYPPDDEGKVSDLEKWVRKCEAAYLASNKGEAEGVLLYRITPKLDGIALRKYRDGPLTTRGDGSKGSDVSHLLEAGVKIIGKDEGPWLDGELVMPWKYFQDHLSGEFSYPRNVLSGLAGSIEYGIHQQEMLDSGMAHMVLYKDLPDRIVNAKALLEYCSEYLSTIKSQCEYLIDGIIIEVMCPHTRLQLGSTDHHHRWMLAYKEKGESAQVAVNSITWQAGRTGIVAPVIEIEPVQLSGALLKRVSGHNIDYLHENDIGPGGVISIVRSGEVIPKHVSTVKGAYTEVPTACPECGSFLRKEGPRLRCDDYECPAKLRGRMEHFFDIMNNCDGFGPSVVDAYVRGNILDVGEVFDHLRLDYLVALGLGPGISSNLIGELERCQSEKVEDWRFLAAIGIEGLGLGDSKKLLREHSLESFILGEVTEADIAKISGFGSIKARKIMKGRELELDLLDYLFFSVGFNLEFTGNPAEVDSTISGKGICFTGKMSKSRTEMEKIAESLGAVCQSGVSSNTDYLVYGGNLGSTKKASAEKHGTVMITEEEFMEMIG